MCVSTMHVLFQNKSFTTRIHIPQSVVEHTGMDKVGSMASIFMFSVNQ